MQKIAMGIAVWFAVILPGQAALSAQAVEAKGTHPRLMFGANDVAALRAKVKAEPYRAMFERLVVDAKTDNMGSGELKPGDNYDEITAAQRCAFLYVCTGDDQWAQQARKYVEARINDAKLWGNSKVKGLSLFYVGKGVALAYDWCHGAPSWDAAFSATVSRKLLEHAEVIFKSGGTEQNTNPASNWQGLRWSTAGLCYLATDDAYNTKNLDDCYARTLRYCKENMGGDHSAGWNIEGLGYTYYPMGNGVSPFAVAMARHNPGKDLRKDGGAGTQNSLWTCYAAMVPTTWGGLLRPDFGDDNAGTNAEGTLGFAFHHCPEPLKPGLRYWYDRTVGSAGNKTFDNSRFGTPASILYYPADLPEQAPLTIEAWRKLMVDPGGNGYFTWRNQYKDTSDLAAQMYVKLRGNKGHNGPDALSFRILGMDGLWAVGGGRYGPKLNGIDAYVRSMNTLYPSDPNGPMGKPSANSGAVVAHSAVNEQGSGWLVSSINLNNVGVKNHKRWFAADYSPASGTVGAYVVCDTSESGKVWQLCTLENHKITTEGNTFTITAPTGATMRGTVLYPPASAVQFQTGTRIRGSNIGEFKQNNYVHFGSDDGCYLVAMTVAAMGQPHPAVQAEGAWGKTPAGTVTIGGLKVGVAENAMTLGGK